MAELRCDVEELTEDQRQHLIFGGVYFPTPWRPTGPDYFPFDDDDHRRRLYFLHRDRLLADPSVSPGMRPRAMRDYEPENAA